MAWTKMANASCVTHLRLFCGTTFRRDGFAKLALEVRRPQLHLAKARSSSFVRVVRLDGGEGEGIAVACLAVSVSLQLQMGVRPVPRAACFTAANLGPQAASWTCGLSSTSSYGLRTLEAQSACSCPPSGTGPHRGRLASCRRQRRDRS